VPRAAGRCSRRRKAPTFLVDTSFGTLVVCCHPKRKTPISSSLKIGSVVQASVMAAKPAAFEVALPTFRKGSMRLSGFVLPVFDTMSLSFVKEQMDELTESTYPQLLLNLILDQNTKIDRLIERQDCKLE
jgi:hypothetical protein